MNRLLIFVIITFVVCVPPLAAQNCEGPLGTIRVANTDRNEISVRLRHTMSATDFNAARSPHRWIIVDVSRAPAPERIFSVVDVRDDRRDLSLPIANLFITLNRSLEDNHEYRIFAPDVTFLNGCRPQAVPEGSLTVRPAAVAAHGGRITPPETNFFTKSPAKGREDSNVYLSGQIEGAKGSAPQISADVKLESPFDTATFFHEIGPYFNLKASTSDDADANSMNFGLKLRHAFLVPVRLKKGTTQLADKQPLLTSVVWELTPGFESDRRFDNVNTMLGTRFIFVPRVFGNSSRIYFQPFVGFEVGRNLKSPVVEAEDRGIARGTVGGSLYLNLMPKADKSVSVQIDYIRRFLLRREISFTEDDDKLVPLAIGRGPRDYLKTALEYGFTDFLGVAFSYEYGRLPPNFQLVDHKYGFGLTYKFKTRFPE